MISTITKITVLLCMAWQAQGTLFNVNVLTDGTDANPGDGICEVTVGMADCSLRAATNEINVLGGSHQIVLGVGIYQLTLVGEEGDGLAGDLNIYGASVVITGQSVTDTIIDGNELGTVLQVGNNGSFTLEQLTITGGRADSAPESAGGGLVFSGSSTVATLNSVAVLDNVANIGGGIYIVGATVIITNSLIQGNAAEPFGFTNTFGQAIYGNGGVLHVHTSTITENQPGSKAIQIDGGEVYISNSTISGNEGGGLRTSNSSGVVRASTFYNTVGQNISHFSFDDSHVLAVGSSVLTTGATQPTDNCQAGDKPVSLGYNVVNDLSCAFLATGDQENATAIISPLADNGGMWPTHDLTTTSAAIDNVPVANCVDADDNDLLLDQRGETRPFGVACDAGAVEYINSDVIFQNGFE